MREKTTIAERITITAALIPVIVIFSVVAYLLGKLDGAREASRNHVITCNTITVAAVDNGIRARCDND